jgi:hypothetical protein
VTRFGHIDLDQAMDDLPSPPQVSRIQGKPPHRGNWFDAVLFFFVLHVP